jgi:hypothetical protein
MKIKDFQSALMNFKSFAFSFIDKTFVTFVV